MKDQVSWFTEIKVLKEKKRGEKPGYKTQINKGLNKKEKERVS